jgi:hypothetical protein
MFEIPSLRRCYRAGGTASRCCRVIVRACRVVAVAVSFRLRVVFPDKPLRLQVAQVCNHYCRYRYHAILAEHAGFINICRLSFDGYKCRYRFRCCCCCRIQCGILLLLLVPPALELCSTMVHCCMQLPDAATCSTALLSWCSHRPWVSL